ncbi:MAG: 50S ribosomal protein L1 [Candidatus Micrarchaeota archaeon]
MVDKKIIEKAVATALEDKGKRKFSQSIDLAINFKDVDFKKAENRISLDITLPYAPKKTVIAVFADGQLSTDAKAANADSVFSGADIVSFAADKKRQKELLNYSILAAPQLMVQIGKALGQVLGARGRLPKPILPNANLKELFDRTRRTITLKTKGKYLPSLHCIVGSESQSDDQIVENVMAVLDAVEKKTGAASIRTIFVKMTMGKPVKIG